MRVARLGTFELDFAAEELRKSGRLVALTGQPMRVLIRLVERAGEVVTREDLRREIWGETHVDFEAGLSTCINQIRTALGDKAAAPRFIETLPRRGYRFIAPVEWLHPSASSSPAPVPPAARPRRIGAVSLAALLAAVVIASLSTAREPGPVPMMVIPVQVDPELRGLDSTSRTLTDAFIGALATEAGTRARILSPFVLHMIRNPTVAGIQQTGVEYLVFVVLRPLGGPVLVHVKLIGPGGWMTWTADRTVTVEELERGPVQIAEEISKPLMESIVGRRAS